MAFMLDVLDVVRILGGLMKFRILQFIKRIRAGIQKPIFRSSSKACEKLHHWTTIEQVLQEGDRKLLKSLCEESKFAPLDSLVRGNLICRDCGQIAHYNINLNIENLIINLRAFDNEPS